MTFSKADGGAPITISRKQRLNTKSSTEAELVAVDDVSTLVLWTRLFLECQGHATTDATLHQDNKSAILLEKNGRASSGERTKHIDVRHHFIRDLIEMENFF